MPETEEDRHSDRDKVPACFDSRAAAIQKDNSACVERTHGTSSAARVAALMVRSDPRGSPGNHLENWACSHLGCHMELIELVALTWMLVIIVPNSTFSLVYSVLPPGDRADSLGSCSNPSASRNGLCAIDLNSTRSFFVKPSQRQRQKRTSGQIAVCGACRRLLSCYKSKCSSRGKIKCGVRGWAVVLAIHLFRHSRSSGHVE